MHTDRKVARITELSISLLRVLCNSHTFSIEGIKFLGMFIPIVASSNSILVYSSSDNG